MDAIEVDDAMEAESSGPKPHERYRATEENATEEDATIELEPIGKTTSAGTNISLPSIDNLLADAGLDDGSPILSPLLEAEDEEYEYVPAHYFLDNLSLVPDNNDDDNDGNDDDDEGYNDNDGDSGIGSRSIHDETHSLGSEITRYRFENNRRYHAYKDGEYWGPNDEKQNNQLDIGHHLYLLTLDNKLFLAPIGDNPQRVLDVGTGTGVWAIGFADRFPSAEVIGFDLSPIQPTWVSPNLRFEINDACSDDWAYPRSSFDFIHVRGLYGSIADWPEFYQQVIDHLRPGGWIEQVEMSVIPISDDGTVTPDNIFGKWGEVSIEAGEKFGKTLRINELMKDYIIEAKFQNVTEKAYKWPIGPWPRDPKKKQMGVWNLLHWEEGIEGWSLALLTRVLGWSYTEVQAYLGKMRSGLKDRNIHAYHMLNVVYAQKPFENDDDSTSPK